MKSGIFIWLGAIALELALLCGYFELSPALDAFRWMWILVAGGTIHFFIAHHAIRKWIHPRRAEMVAIFLIAVVFRLTMLPLIPSLSDDAYRSIWDGRVQAAGLNPYIYAPTAPEVSGLVDEHVWPKINHPDLKTIYPPASQILALASNRLGLVIDPENSHPVLPWKLTLLLVELAGAAVLAYALYKKGRGAAFLVYGWSPLAVVEFYGSGHVDAAGVGLLAATSGFILLHRRAASGIAFAAAVLTKLVALPVAIGFIALRGKWKRVLAATLTAIVLCVPYSSSGRSAIESLTLYQAEWEFNGVIHRLLHVDAWAAAPDRIEREEWNRLFDPGTVLEKRRGRLIITLIVLGGGLAAILSGAAPSAVTLWTLGAFLLVQPTIHPWYLTWLLPLLAVRYARAFLLWTATIPFTYEILIAERIGQGWIENQALQLASILPVLFFMLWDLRRHDFGVAVVDPSTAEDDDLTDRAPV